MRTLDILMILKLDDIRLFLEFMFWIATGFIMGGGFVYSLLYSVDGKDEVQWLKAPLKLGCIIGFISLCLWTLIPSASQIITSIAAPTIFNNKSVIETVPKLLTVIELELDKKLKILKNGENHE